MANHLDKRAAAQRGRLIRFGVFELNPLSGELRKHGVRIRLREQSIQILLMLLEQPGQVVLREEIRTKLWANDTTVGFDHGINGAIQRLREALGDSAQNPRFIETVARRGYRFLVQTLDVPAPESESTAPEAPNEIPSAESVRPATKAVRLPVVLAAGLLLGALAGSLIQTPDRPESEVRFLIAPPEQIPNPGAPQIALSPDGRLLAIVTESYPGRRRSLWIRPLGSLDATRLISDSDFESPIQGFPFWSADGKFIAYFTERAIWKIAAGGGPPQKICDECRGEGGAWSADGTILFGTANGPLYRVAPTGSKPVPATQLNAGGGDRSHSWPQFLPDGSHFLYLARNREKGTRFTSKDWVLRLARSSWPTRPGPCTRLLAISCSPAGTR